MPQWRMLLAISSDPDEPPQAVVQVGYQWYEAGIDEHPADAIAKAIEAVLIEESR